MPLGDAPYERVGEGVVVSTDRRRLDVGMVHRFLSQTYWVALFTRDEATLYARDDFAAAEGLPSYMELVDREVYLRSER